MPPLQTSQRSGEISPYLWATVPRPLTVSVAERNLHAGPPSACVGLPHSRGPIIGLSQPSVSSPLLIHTDGAFTHTSHGFTDPAEAGPQRPKHSNKSADVCNVERHSNMNLYVYFVCKWVLGCVPKHICTTGAHINTNIKALLCTVCTY